MAVPQSPAKTASPTTGQIAHVVKLIFAAIPAIVAVVAPDLSQPVQAVLAGITALASSAEVLAHAIGGSKL